MSFGIYKTTLYRVCMFWRCDISIDYWSRGTVSWVRLPYGHIRLGHLALGLLRGRTHVQNRTGSRRMTARSCWRGIRFTIGPILQYPNHDAQHQHNYATVPQSPYLLQWRQPGRSSARVLLDPSFPFVSSLSSLHQPTSRDHPMRLRIRYDYGRHYVSRYSITVDVWFLFCIICYIRLRFAFVIVSTRRIL